MSKWDPIGVCDVREAADEYDSYIWGIYALLKRGLMIKKSLDIFSRSKPSGWASQTSTENHLFLPSFGKQPLRNYERYYLQPHVRDELPTIRK